MPAVDDIRLLVERIVAQQRGSDIRAGVISSTSPLEVTLWGDTVAVPAGLRSSAYTPTAGDKVIILSIPPQLVVLCKVVAG